MRKEQRRTERSTKGVPVKKPLRDLRSAKPQKAPADERVYGLNACLALVKKRPHEIVRLYLAKDLVPLFSDTLRALAAQKLTYRILPDEELQKVSGSTHHEGVCIVAKPLPVAEERLEPFLEKLREGCLLFLDGVQNPHNFGAIVRVAAHLGAAGVIVAGQDHSPLSGAAHRISEGGVEEIPVFHSKDPLATLRRLQQHKFALVSTVVDKGESLFSTRLPSKLVYLLGAEDRGLRNDLQRLSDKAVTIPRSGEVESLNVATAAAVLLAEYQRQRASA